MSSRGEHWDLEIGEQTCLSADERPWSALNCLPGGCGANIFFSSGRSNNFFDQPKASSRSSGVTP